MATGVAAGGAIVRWYITGAKVAERITSQVPSGSAALGWMIRFDSTLLVKKAAVMATENPIEIPTLTATVPPTETTPPVLTTTMSTPTSTPTDVNAVPPAQGPVTGVVIGIIVIALLVGGIFTWLGNSRKAEQ